MAFNQNSIAAANAVGIKNVQFSPIARVLKRKILLIGTYDPLKTNVVDDVPVRVLSAQDVASQFGEGSMVHRLAMKSFQGSNGVETFIAPQADPVAGVKALGSIIVDAETSIESGIIYLYVAGQQVQVPVTLGMTETQITDALAAAINKMTSLPLTALASLDAATNGFLLTGNATANLAALQAVANGEFSVTINGTLRNITALNLTAATTLSDIAAIIQTTIQVLVPGFLVTESSGIFDFVSPTTGAASIVSYLGAVSGGLGTDISGPTMLKGKLADGALATAGADDVNAVDLTAKSKTTYGNEIKLDLNLLYGEFLPVGLTLTLTDLAGGSGIPDIGLVLTQLGENEEGFTDLSHGYGLNPSTLNELSIYNGEGNDFAGLYSKLIARPFRSLNGNTVAGSTGLAALIVLADTRKVDRTNGVLAVPGSTNHPAEIAALALGKMAMINSNRAEETQINQLLPGIFQGSKEDNWCSDYDSRNTAVLNGISPSLATDEGVKLQNVVTFYRPDNVAIESNGYRSQRNISIIQNLLAAEKLNFSREFWQGTTIVEDTALVTNSNSQKKARDVSDVLSDLLELTNQFMSNAWIYSSAFTIEKLKQDGLIVVKPGGNGFVSTLPVILSGEGGILDSEIEFDVSLAILL